MESIDYIDIPPWATRIKSTPTKSKSGSRHTPSPIRTSLPHPQTDTPHPQPTSILSPTNAALNFLPNVLMSSVPTNPPTEKPKKRKPGQTPLLSIRDPLSLAIMSANFRRFVSKVGPVFWLQDRVEEIVMWRRGWKMTSTWIAAYAFLCYFPRLLLLLPQVAIIAVILATYKYTSSSSDTSTVPVEDSVAWQANIQAIQNLMGFYSDAYDAVHPLVLNLTHRTPFTLPLLTLVTLSLIPGVVLVSLPSLPIRAICLSLGIVPLALTNPHVQSSLLLLFRIDRNLRWLRSKLGLDPKLPLTTFVQRLIDDNNLADSCWTAEMREVEIFENERHLDAQGETEKSWSKENLKSDERSAWTRGPDGLSGSVSSNLTFTLEPGWYFVQTEDWRLDVDATWTPQGGDSNGWVYTNDSWLDPRPSNAGGAATRKRRWVRQIWYNPPVDN
ncbi:integral peroxisomal membrane peroxin-domain-containing protein [Desarmillaria tabescens]|uniref:Integral peroxisomal membrane peroxin-domain-containing protein n=1 Tax=Armillaria tabescens TaxID=1929756 RepID=A0AA39KCK9_ARMTA|nr:integral peroxisomal membrane peroxin-domain-containing protein [Desarmillaria tabescens]KAK0457485.1 integral peroxisomal membrane peroxin-domain-containing protein [Desarmillaria tabescens]